MSVKYVVSIVLCQIMLLFPLQVDAWLQKVFAGQSVPAYEVTEQTLDLLTQLKQSNERQEKYNQLIVQDMQLKADEYRVEGIIQELLGNGPPSQSSAIAKRSLISSSGIRDRVRLAFLYESLPEIRLGLGMGLDMHFLVCFLHDGRPESNTCYIETQTKTYTLRLDFDFHPRVASRQHHC